jgi:hypothetical protein
MSRIQVSFPVTDSPVQDLSHLLATTNDVSSPVSNNGPTGLQVESAYWERYYLDVAGEYDRNPSEVSSQLAVVNREQARLFALTKGISTNIHIFKRSLLSYRGN